MTEKNERAALAPGAALKLSAKDRKESLEAARKRGTATTKNLLRKGNYRTIQRQEEDRKKRFKRREMEDLQFWVDIGWRP